MSAVCRLALIPGEVRNITRKNVFEAPSEMTANRDISSDTAIEKDALAEQSASIGNGEGQPLPDMESALRKQVTKWQSKLLDLGNRNPLINCSFNATRGVIELVAPDTETIWNAWQVREPQARTP